MKVNPFEQIQEELGYSKQAIYLYNYLNFLKAKTTVIEEKYVDKDYIIDYSKFYARSFNGPDKFTKRIHFFSELFFIDEFKQVLLDNNMEFLNKLEKSYLGFVIVKPIKSEGYDLIGRTIIRTYPPLNDNKESRVFIKRKYQVSLFGIPLCIESLPFQSQDIAVGACATTALWVCLHPLHKRFGIPQYSPYEITEQSVSFPAETRNFPSSGLELKQIKSYFNLMGLETEFLNIEYSKMSNIIDDIVKVYINAGFPIVAALSLKKRNYEAYHAVVISGYRHNNGALTELYVHDDQIGPYSRVRSDEKFNIWRKSGKFVKWRNEWIEKYGYTDVSVKQLLIPIYPKIRLTFPRIYQVLLYYRSLIKSYENLNANLCLTQVRDYKTFLLRKSFENKEKILTDSFHRFLWVVRINSGNIPLQDCIYDATSVYPLKLYDIRFR